VSLSLGEEKVGADGSFEEQETRGSRCMPGSAEQQIEEVENCVQAGHLLTTQRKNFLGSEGEQADDLSTGSTPTGNVEGSFAFIVSCGEGL